MRVAFGILLMGTALAGCVFLGALGAGLAGANPDNFFPMFMVFWGFFGPLFFLGLYLTMGGTSLETRTQLVLLGLAIASVLGAGVAARTLG